MTPAGLLAYYYGWDQDGNRLWLMSDIGPTSATPGTPITLQLSRTRGGQLLTPAPPSTFTPWGTLTLDFADSATAAATMSGADGKVNLSLQKLVGISTEASVMGLWYDPAYNGSGFNVITTAAGPIFYYYGWDKDGHRLWLMAGPLGGGPSMSPGLHLWQPMYMTEGGRFLTPAKPSTMTLWGTLQLNLTSCTTATATLSRGDTTVVMNNLQLLTGVLDMPPC
jgi:hypothetical protein